MWPSVTHNFPSKMGTSFKFLSIYYISFLARLEEVEVQRVHRKDEAGK